jgi:hypothetical protein
MGIFDRVEKDAEEAMAQDEPRIAQQAGHLGGAQLDGGPAIQDRQATENLTGKPGGARDPDQGQDGSDQDYSDEDW